MSDKKPVPVDIDKIDLDKLKEKVADLPSLMEYAHSVGGFSIVPTNEGHIKGVAMQAMKEQTEEQLHIIYDQMKLLAKQVQDIKKRVEVSEMIYGAEMSFQPVIGKRYFLYERENGSRFLSLISPKEWGDKMNDKKCLSEIQLMSDHTWKRIKEN